MTLLLLDFDGVLHLDPSANQFKFWQRNLIEDILRDSRRWTSCFPQPGAFATRWTLQATPLNIIFRAISPNSSWGSRQITRAWVAIRCQTALISNTQRAEQYDGPRKVFEGDQK